MKHRKDWMGEEKCRICGARIEGMEDRVVVAIFDLAYVFDEEEENPLDIDPEAFLLPCCSKCAGTVEEFRIRNPFRIVSPLHEPSANGTSRPSEPEPNSAARGSSDDLARAVAAGDMEEFNAAYPPEPFPSHSDALAHSVPGVDPDTAEEGKSRPVLDETARKEKLRRFLNDPRSRGISPKVRDVARRWVKGASQTEIANAKQMNQGSVSRLLSVALDLAHKQR